MSSIFVKQTSFDFFSSMTIYFTFHHWSRVYVSLGEVQEMKNLHIAQLDILILPLDEISFSYFYAQELNYLQNPNLKIQQQQLFFFQNLNN